jgi:cytochrome subunit of sulfide dehydrogenase
MRALILAAIFLSSHALAADSGSHIRVLAASCAACHGTNGNSIGGTPVLAGLERLHFLQQMQSFRDGARSSTVMHHHAQGLTLPEIEGLADFFSAQQRQHAELPPFP